MGVQVHRGEHSSTVGPAQLFNALVLNAVNLVPKVVPQARAELLRGNGGPKTIMKITFGEGSNHGRYMKYRVDALDEENLFYAYTLIEGDTLTDKFEKIEYQVKFVGTPPEGCVIKSVTKYYTKGELGIVDSSINDDKEKDRQQFKLFEGYVKDHLDEF